MVVSAIAWLASKLGVSRGVIVTGALVLAMGGAWGYHSYQVDHAYESGRSAAIIEYNVVQLEEDLAFAETRLAAETARADTMAEELRRRSEEALERERFIQQLNVDVEEFDDGTLSDRSRAFATILSQRSQRYRNDEDG